LGQLAIVEVMIDFREYRPELEFLGLRVEEFPVASETTKFDLVFSVSEMTSDGASLQIRYAADLFDRATIEQFAGHLTQLLNSVLAEPDRQLSALSMVCPEELSRRERAPFRGAHGEAVNYHRIRLHRVSLRRQSSGRMRSRLSVIKKSGLTADLVLKRAVSRHCCCKSEEHQASQSVCFFRMSRSR
jgi:hypothetical protein